MPIITNQGIYTKELCVDSKKYLSHLLIGKFGINPNFLTWDHLLTIKFNVNDAIEIYQKTLSKEEIENELIKLECQNHQKAYLASKK
jgi:hypothetical protein